jgi:basic membrane protein A and related proteins
MPKSAGTSVLTTLMFTDIVGSTAAAEEMGDRRWRELLARHHRIVRKALREFGGIELDTAGDGVFARFDSTASAVRCACSIEDEVRELGIEIRAGVHIGECELFDRKLSGVHVHVAARTMAQAGAGEVLVTGSIPDLVRGAGIAFSDRGTHELRGIAGEWHLFEATSVDGSPRPAPLSEEESRSRRDAIVPPPLVQRRRVRLAGAVAAVVLLVSGASVALAHALSGGAAKVPLTGCEVTSLPPLNDRAFNQAVFDGLTDAASTWGISVRDAVAQPVGSDRQEAEWTGLMNQFAKKNCGLIVSVGSAMANATKEAARTSPSERFLVTDANASGGPANLLGVVFKSDQAAFLAGYLSAATSRTGKVATFGGIPIPPVLSYMDGFAAGVLYYNKVNHKNVRLLGWNPKTRTGTFVSQNTSDYGSFSDTGAAAHITANLISQGADIVMPVDGQGGEHGAGRAAERAPGVLLIGVDSDQHFSAPQYEALWLTSVLKVFRRMVYVAMGDVVHDRFQGGGVLTGTLDNGGVGLAPLYGLENRVPGPLRTKLAEIKKGIANGSISVDPGHYAGAQ